MGLGTKTYWLTDRQSQCDFDFDFDFEELSTPCGGLVKHLNRKPASFRRWRKGKSRIWDSKNMVTSPTGLGPENEYAGKGQQHL
jgi:hypothetical protein